MPMEIREIMFAIIGLVTGSFINVITIRNSDKNTREKLERDYVLENYGVDIKPDLKESVFNNMRSVCPTCGKQLAWYHNIPIFSYIFLRGRCAFCRTHISFEYPVVEMLVCWLFVYSAYSFHFLFSIHVLLVAFILSVSVVISTIDLKTSTIMDKHSIALVIASVFLLTESGFIAMHVLCLSMLGVVGLYIFVNVYEKLRAKITGSKLNVFGDGDYALIFVLLITMISSPLSYKYAFGSLDIIVGGFVFMSVLQIILSVIIKKKQVPLAPAILITNALLLMSH